MLKINLHSQYSDLKSFTFGRTPKYIEWVKEGGALDIYVDDKVRTEKIEPLSCALLIEPRSIQESVYDYIYENSDKFTMIFTHDSELMRLPNANLINFGGVYDYNNIRKDKNVSMVSSKKNMCGLHADRLEVIAELDKWDGVDTFGTWNGGDFVDVYQYLAPYRFSVIMENHIDDYWFTEKICNCFANMTIPIYYGARRITEIFHPLGIYQVSSISDIYCVVNYLLEHGEAEYNWRRPFVKINRDRVTQYECFEDTLFKRHKELLEFIVEHKANK